MADLTAADVRELMSIAQDNAWRNLGLRLDPRWSPQVVALCRLALAVLEPGEQKPIAWLVEVQGHLCGHRLFTIESEAREELSMWNVPARLIPVYDPDELARLRAENAELRKDRT